MDTTEGFGLMKKINNGLLILLFSGVAYGADNEVYIEQSGATAT